MPVYHYKCKTCGDEFHYQQSIKADALTKCPESVCKAEHKGEGEVIRKISKNIGLVFNGSGFYLTDYVHNREKLPNHVASTGGSKPAETSSTKSSDTSTTKSESSS